MASGSFIGSTAANLGTERRERERVCVCGRRERERERRVREKQTNQKRDLERV